MAQWLGQYTGRTHATKVADREEILRTAISKLLATDSNGVAPPNLAPLAQRVIDARLKCMRAELSVLREPRSTGMPLEQIDSLEHRIRALESGGILEVLREFRCPQHIIEAMPEAPRNEHGHR